MDSVVAGQILALFITVPPFLQVCQLAPQIWSWVINLSWIACCWRRRRRVKQSAPTGEPDLSYEAVNYKPLENPVLLEGQSGQLYEERQEMQASAMRLEPNRYYGAW